MSAVRPDALDALFQASLADFTATRNALAKASGGEGAAIKQIEKPSASAWAVNQIYWRHRRTYDALVRASERVRAAQRQQLEGTRVDLTPLERAHRAAVRDASDLARNDLTSAGDAATPATLKAVRETLQTLPVAGPPGRLTRPLGLVGFEALSQLLGQAGSKKDTAKIFAFPASSTAPGRKRPDTASIQKAAPSKETTRATDAARLREAARTEDARRREEAERREEAAREAKRAKAAAAARAAKRKTLVAKRAALGRRLEVAQARIKALQDDLRSATQEVDEVRRDIHGVDGELADLDG